MVDSTDFFIIFNICNIPAMRRETAEASAMVRCTEYCNWRSA
jgi:hypothetical protein